MPTNIPKDAYAIHAVHMRDKERVIEDLVDLFDHFEVDGRRVVKSVYTKEEVYSSPYLDQSPDLILLGNQDFNLRASMKAVESTDKTIFTGKHAQETAFFLAMNSCEANAVPGNLRVYDVRQIIESIP